MGYKYYAQKKRPPAFLNLMRTWGEAGAVKTLTKTATKPIDTVVSCMMVVYNVNSGANMYRMCNLKTNIIHNSRDVIWLKRVY